MDAIVDSAVVRALNEELGAERAGALGASYLATLEERVYHLRAALAAFDSNRAVIALRGLRSASELVGARALATAVAEIEPAVRAGRYAPARSALPEIMQLAAATTRELSDLLNASTRDGSRLRAPSR
ncbi:hypothetical protein [Georgenia sp. AZ-5]|uniref:hypothetical protein n=1 Tax=Georgenia sp. AZ-5 TaxID=3367526 RepID=UPI0037545715